MHYEYDKKQDNKWVLKKLGSSISNELLNMHTPLSVPIFQHFQNAEFYSGIIPSGRLPFIRHTNYGHQEMK